MLFTYEEILLLNNIAIRYAHLGDLKTAVDMLYQQYLGVAVILSVNDSTAGFFMQHHFSFPELSPNIYSLI